MLTQNPTLIPVLFAVQIGAVWVAARKASARSQLDDPRWIYALLLLVVLWGSFTTYLGVAGTYLQPKLLTSYPTFWLPFIPVVIVMVPLTLVKQTRIAARQLIDATPVTQLIGIHMLRLLALGTLIKAWAGEFSHAFAVWVGIPDMVFGASAILMYWFARNGRIGRIALAIWSLVGVLVILPGAPLVAQRELPGMLFVAEQIPAMTTLYSFPMVLAPTLVVPFFVLLNLLVAIRQIERAGGGKE